MVAEQDFSALRHFVPGKNQAAMRYSSRQIPVMSSHCSLKTKRL
jgi:hypothetical protein